MSFMRPEYVQRSFWMVETRNTTALCDNRDDAMAEVCRILKDNEDTASITLYITLHKDKLWARLSAPGYLDCTEWAGPFESRHEAEGYIWITYEACPSCGTDEDPDPEDPDPEDTAARVRCKKCDHRWRG